MSFFSEDGGADDFALPGDEQTLETLGVEAGPETPSAQPQDVAAKPELETEATEPDVAETPEAITPEPEAETEPELIGGKFKSHEELLAAYQELESFKGRQSNEISELRQALEQRLDALGQQQQTAPPVQITADLIEQNPAAATQLAFEQNNPVVLKEAFEEWEEQQPARAAAWYAARTIEANNQQWTERYAQLEQQIAPLSQQTQTNELQAGVARLREQYPEIGEFLAGNDFADLANKIPLAKKALTDGTTDEVVSAIETVFLIHRGRATDNLTDTAREVARAAAEEAQTVREEAYVASATATTTTPRASRADEIAAGWDDEERLFENGWNV